MLSSTDLATKLTRKEIKALFAQAKRILRRQELDILLAPTVKSIGRLLVVTARSTGTAPERNRVRRRLKAIFYEERFFQQPIDCIVIIKKNGVELPFAELKETLQRAYINFNKELSCG